MKIVMFAGAGAGGKTKLVEATAAMAEERGLKVRTHFSTTRQTYAKYGFDKETDALKDPDMNAKFQHQVLLDNLEAFKRAYREALDDKVDLLIADRTPHDYIAYYFTVFKDRLTLAMVQEKRDVADHALSELWSSEMIGTALHLFMLPFPAVWSTDTNSSDGWRADTTGKNLLWSNTLEAELANIHRRLDQQHWMSGHIKIERLNTYFENGPPEVRAAGVLGTVFPNLI